MNVPSADLSRATDFIWRTARLIDRLRFACENLIALASGADVLVQCCFLADADLTTPARHLLATLVIATSGQVGKIAAQAGVKTLVLTHFSAMEPEMLAAIEADVRRDFGGQLYLGTDLLTIDV